ncbi:YybH family protein [Shewanella waksmanii]|uniref:YybH family protein n=1 Tax=Shewanella waksmanii TaxID=213783 RepID=UPI0037353597
MSTSAQAAVNEHEALNQFYHQFTEAFEHLDTDKLANVYAENACYIPESQGKEITMGKDNILKLYNKFFGKIKHKNAKIEVDFRVIERQLEPQNATDIGYYLIRFHPPAEAEEPVSEFSGKFVNVFKKEADDRWVLTVDTSNRSDPSFYFNAKPSPNLYYGRQYSALPAIESVQAK